MTQTSDFNTAVLIGPPRAGSTFLTHVLDTHPEVKCTDEARPYLSAARALKVLNSRQDYEDRWRKILIPHLRDSIVEFFEDVGVEPGMWALEKFPHYADPSWAPDTLETIELLSPGTKYIFLSRNLKAVTKSMETVNRNHNWLNASPTDIYHAIHKRGVEWQKKVPDRYLHVDYDHGLQTNVEKVCSFLGLEIHPDLQAKIDKELAEPTPVFDPNILVGVRAVPEQQEIRNVLVAGANGFIGRATIAELHRRGIGYTMYDLALNLDHDVRHVDYTGVLPSVDGVINLAGILGTHELFERVEEAIEINTIGAARLLQQVDAENTHRLDADLQPIKYVTISMMDVWDNVYQATKIAGERLAMAWHRHRDTRATIVRAFNGYGPYQKVGGVQKIIPTFATCAWNNEPIPVWGDGSATVDLVHVDDIASCLVQAIFLPGGEKIDAGTSVPVTVTETAERIIEYTGSTGGIDYKPMRLGEHELAEPLVAKGEGWEFIEKQPTFDWDRVMETVDWYRTPRP